jgi:hypothetical protein
LMQRGGGGAPPLNIDVDVEEFPMLDRFEEPTEWVVAPVVQAIA